MSARPDANTGALIEQLLSGNRRALARALTMVENNRSGVEELLSAVYPHTGQAWVIGITGAPGTGKSSLVNALAKAYRTQERTVGIIAVDPTSPFTGGAILGDRIRMRDLSGDKGVFIRSMATRGSLGGVARATRDAVRVMQASGLDIVLVETVGAGQSEVDIVRMAQTTVVVEAPGLGDDVQAIKAGILEIADVLVVNKADRHGAHNTFRALRAMLELGHPVTYSTRHHGHLMTVEAPQTNDDAPESEPFWMPPVVKTVATDETGVSELVEAIARHREFVISHDLLPALEQKHLKIELYDRLREALLKNLLNAIDEQQLQVILAQAQQRDLAPHEAVMRLLSQVNAEPADMRMQK